MKGTVMDTQSSCFFICVVSYDPFINVKNKTLCLCAACICLRQHKIRRGGIWPGTERPKYFTVLHWVCLDVP